MVCRASDAEIRMKKKLSALLCLVLFFGWVRASYAQESPSGQAWKFKNKTTFNLVAVTGNSDSVSLSGTEKFTAKKKTVTNTLTSGITYARDNVFNDSLPAATTGRDIFFKDKLLWEFHPKIYVYGGTGWLTHRGAGIDNQIDALTGLGYKLLLSGRHSLSLEAGYNLMNRDRIAPFPDEGVTHNASFGFDYLWQITYKASLENETDNVFDLRMPESVRITSLTEIEVEIVKHLAVSLTFKVRFDNRPVPTFRKLDTTSTAGIVVLF